jgi:hypothetical protein
MCPRTERPILAIALAMALASDLGLAAAAVAAAPAGLARADDTLEYLESRGLDELSVRRLEELARAAEGDVRAAHLERLATLVARMLDESAEGPAQDRLLARADALVASIDTTRGDQLRLAAARTRYRAAARMAESIRAGIAADGARAASTLEAQAAELLRIAGRADERGKALDRRLDRSEGLGRDILDEQLVEERSLAGQARFLAAWSLLYEGWLARTKPELEQAKALFADMLGARDGQLAPADVSEDLRREEAFASAILGLALVKARLDGHAEATRWLALLESRETVASIRDAIDGWKMVAALDGGGFESARRSFARLSGREDIGNWARVAVARSVEDGGTSPEAALLQREALAQLAAARDLAAVRALVTRYGDAILGADASGFVPLYVRALRLYEDSQAAIAEAGADVERLAAPDLRADAQASADALGAALAAADAASFPDAATACREMRAWSLRGAGEFAEAARAFDAVADERVGMRAENASRVAIGCIEDARAATKDPAERTKLEAELVARVDAFLSRFPGSDHVPELLVRKVALSATPDSADVEELLRVKPDSPEWLSSRRQAVFALYRVFRGGKAPRVETARRYMEVLNELPVDEGTGLPAGSPAIARQALEVALATEIRDTRLATNLLEGLAKAGAAGAFDLREADEELAYRRLQLAMYANRWADAALRLAIRGAEARRRAADEDAPERGGFVATIVRAGDAIFERAGGAAVALGAKDAERALLDLARIALDARVELLGSSSDPEEGKRGLVIADALLERAPRDATLLRAAALCGERAGDLERAAERLRALVGGLPARSEPWFAAKVDQIRVLAALDPARARAVIAQFRALYPELGPTAVRDRILEIERSLPPEQAPAGGAP